MMGQGHSGCFGTLEGAGTNIDAGIGIKTFSLGAVRMDTMSSAFADNRIGGEIWEKKIRMMQIIPVNKRNIETN